MATQSASPTLVRFEDFELDLRTGELRRKGVAVKLPPQPSKVLVLLVSRAGQLVTRQEIAAQVWGSGTFVDFEQGLNFAIRQIRTALADDADHPRYLETFPKRGYRFTAAVSESNAPVPVAVPPPEPIVKMGTSTRPYAIAFVIIAVAIAATFVIRRDYFRKPASSAPGNSGIHSLAVLPLHNLSSDPEQEYFSDGMTDELITDLARVGRLKVISHTSVQRYRETNKSLPEIAQELGVEAVVEGTVMRSGNRVRITAQLIDARSDQHLWAESYERDFRDTLAMQSEVARQIAAEIGINLTAGEKARFASNPTVDPVAYEAYLKGNFYWDQLNCAGFTKGLEYFQQAAAKDPTFAPAYVGMSDSYFNLADWECVPQDEAFAKSKEAALKALEIDPASGEAHVQLGELAFYHEWDWPKAEKELKQGIALDPNEGHSTYAIFLVAMGRQEEGLAEMRKAHEIDPVSELSNVLSTYVFYLTHHFDEAIDQAKKTLELYPRSGATFYWLGMSYEMKGMNQEAINTYLRGDVINGMKDEQIAAYRNAYQKSGMAGYWRLEQNTVRPKKFNGVCWEMLCSRHYPDKQRTLQLLNLGFQRHCDGLQFLKVDPIYQDFQGDPKFNDLLARMQF